MTEANIETDGAQVVLDRIKAACRKGARFDVVPLFMQPIQRWGVQVYEPGTTKGGNHKWVKIILLVPNDGETIADTLKMLADFTTEADR